MLAHTEPQVIGKRYVLHEQLGAGGMGAVHRASDRLDGRVIALKRVATPTDQLDFSSRGDGTNVRIALANEFKTLASLRHPHIISVLDYGFDAHHQPYFTMNLLDKPRTIVQAGQGQPIAVQIRLLIALLQAVAYLHRRNIVHRDLKPGNVMVVSDVTDRSGDVKVLDFGLSVLATPGTTKITNRMTGTLAYMAPELFQGRPAGKASDLYAVGLMAYEMFAGRYPFDSPNIAALINNILSTEVDITACGLDENLGGVLARLLVKNPRERYGDAQEVITALWASARQPLPPETIEIRESFLQAARFVGREGELAALSGCLSDALAGRGSAWLVAGESGIGKSRLVEELRTLALVNGALVVRGQAVSDGGSSYQVWRDVLRWLCLLSDPTDQEAGVLKNLVPDITTLLGRDIPDAPLLDPLATQRRLLTVVTNMVRRQRQPLVIIVEDLQWAGSESIALLERLSEVISKLPLLIVGNYRDDERPTLSGELPGMHVLPLKRLTEAGVAALGESMLGASGRQPQLVHLLYRETEGNIFFVVEMVRALAEEAGTLGQIGRKGLPEKILAGGVQRVLQRRLERVPPEARPLLHFAAALGRQLDLDVLRVLAPEVNLNWWLAACAGVAVLDVQEQVWRFAHDKLRDAVIAGLHRADLPGIYRQAAEAVEKVHPEEGEFAATLAHLWHVAGDSAKERHYSALAGQRAVSHNANVEAIAFFSRALEIVKAQPETPERAPQELTLLVQLSAPLQAAKGYAAPEFGQSLVRARELCRQLGDTPEVSTVLCLLIIFHSLRAEHAISREIESQLLPLAEHSADPLLLAAIHHIVGFSTTVRGEFAEGLAHVDYMIRVYDPQQYHGLTYTFGTDPMISALSWSSWDLWFLGYPEQALKRSEAALALAQEQDHTFGLAFAQSVDGILLHQFCRDYEAVKKWAEAFSTLSTEQGFSLFQAAAPLFLGWGQANDGHIDEAVLAQIRQGGDAWSAGGAELHHPQTLAYLAHFSAQMGRIQEGLALVDEALILVDKTEERYFEAEVHRVKGELLWMKGDEAEAETSFHRAIEVARKQSAKSWELRATVSLARLWREQRKSEQAKATLAAIFGWFTEGFDLPDLKDARALLDQLE